MSHDINGELASMSVHARPAAIQDIGQRQQWKLALEKAYLALGQATEREAVNDRERKVPSHVDEENDAIRTDVQSAGVGGLPPECPEGVPAQYASSPGARFANENSPGSGTVEGVEKAMVTAFRGEGGFQIFITEGGVDNYAGKDLSVPEKNGVAPKSFEMAVKETTFHFYLEDGSVYLSMRHGGVLDTAQVGRIISVVRALLEGQGLHLAKVTMNGVEQWEGRGPRRQQSIADDDTRLNEIDRMY